MLGFKWGKKKPSMSLLDCGCGCGPGSITVDLAQEVAPGPVVGVDLDEGSLDGARELAEKQGVSNVSFQTGSVYDLPFPDASFDAVLANQLVNHLNDPVKAIKEMGRVLKPGGVVGLNTIDFGSRIIYPDFPAIGKFLDIQERGIALNGGNCRLGREFRDLLSRVGCFNRIEPSATCFYYPQPEVSCQKLAETLINRIANIPLFTRAVQLGWTDQAELAEMEAALREWGEHPGAFMARIRVHAVAWKV